MRARWLLPLLLLPSAAADTYPRQPSIDAQHYLFRLSLSDDTDEIQGEATVTVRLLDPAVSQFSLDLASPADGKGMTVSEVVSAASPLHFTHVSDRLTIALPPQAGDLRTVTVRYHGIPASGLRIGPDKYRDRTFFTDNWPNHAHQWLPIIDHPYDKATSEFLITAPSKYLVVSNGLLLEETDLSDGRRMTHWKQSVPIAAWLNAS
jgi:aminopeptidase N